MTRSKLGECVGDTLAVPRILLAEVEAILFDGIRVSEILSAERTYHPAALFMIRCIPSRTQPSPPWPICRIWS